MAQPPDNSNRPEAGADTAFGKPGTGTTPRDAQSGGHRSAAGGTYGDYVPDRGQPRHNDDRDTAPANTANGQDWTRADPPISPDGTNDPAAAEQERISEVAQNKPFDTPHVHHSTTSRKV
jgi:hypothetical protein